MIDLTEETVVEVSNLHKKFSMTVGATRLQLKSVLMSAFFDADSGVDMDLQKDEFWALHEVEFKIKKNERLAIIGPNGSGKSTLLKMLTGVYLPDAGSIEVTGNVGSILELSTGFKPELSGRQNIYLKFMLFRKSREEVDEIIEEVIEFSELGDFIEAPLKNYSSGMKARLGFAIAVHMAPDILILDEVFATGDRRFRTKSENKIRELYSSNTTILVTHSMDIVRKVADRVCVLESGKMVYLGDVSGGIEFYESMMSD